MAGIEGQLMEAPRAIFFDLDGTILDWQTGMEEHWREACAAGCREAPGLELDSLFEAVARTRTWFWSEPERARIGRMDLLGASRAIVRQALLDLGCDDETLAHRVADDYRTRRDGAIAPYPGALDVLQAARERRIATALITNGNARAQRRSVERFGLAPYFDCIVIEGEFGCDKPDERIFRHALDTCAVQPSDTWMIGDNLDADIATPLRLGMHTVWVDSAASGLPEDAPVTPHRIVRSIAELFGGLGP